MSRAYLPVSSPGKGLAAPKPPKTPIHESVDETKDEYDPCDYERIAGSPEVSLETKRALVASALGVTTSGGVSGGSTLQALPRSARSMTQTYHLRIVTAGAVTPTAGVASSSFLCDPSNIPLSQWSTFAALFDEVRLNSFSVTIAPYQDYRSSFTGPLISSIAMGSFYSKTTTPGNIVNVLMAGDGELVSPLMVKPHKHTMKVPKLGFAPTSAPGGDTFRGCPGSVQLYATGVGSQSMLTYFVCGVYELRGRV